MTFPASPTNGQQATEGGRLYQYNGSNAWELVANVAGHAATHAAGGADAITPASIGAAATSHTHAYSSLTGTPSTFTPSSHASSHAAAGSDPLSIAASQVTGTLDDARLSANVATYSALAANVGQPTDSVDVFSREAANNANVVLETGRTLICFFTPRQTVTVSQIAMYSAGTAAAGLTFAQMGLYTFDGTTATLVARCAVDTTLFTAVNTAYTRSFSATGGYPATYTLQAGVRYGAAVLCIGTTMPALAGRTTAVPLSVLSPRSTAQYLSQTSLAATLTSPSVTSNHQFTRLS